jgi:uncharacterized protein
MMTGEKNMEEKVALTLGTTAVVLCGDRALYLPAHRAVVIADLHFGKVNHFRRAGLPVPPRANNRNAERLIDLLVQLNPSRAIFLGDLFHSAYNDDWEVVGQIVRHFPACSFDLVLGNHDILSDQQYRRLGIRVLDHEVIDRLWLTHEPLPAERIPEDHINVAGHLHPAASLIGKGRQSLKLPCFWLSARQCILPAFGSFTGLAPIYPGQHDAVFTIVDGRIMELRPASLGNSSPAS